MKKLNYKQIKKINKKRLINSSITYFLYIALLFFLIPKIDNYYILYIIITLGILSSIIYSWQLYLIIEIFLLIKNIDRKKFFYRYFKGW
jgi:hypothetical protein